MAAQVSNFAFQQSLKIRVLIDDNNNPLFCLADVCKVLELTNPSAVAAQVKDEFGCPNLNLGHIQDTLGRDQNAIFLTEPQLYFVMMRSRAKMAHTFRQWIVNEVLPSIRRNGCYISRRSTQTVLADNSKRLTSSQMQLISNFLDTFSRFYFFKDVFKTAAWAAIRTATGIASPDPLTKASLPKAKEALDRILHISDQYASAIFEIEKTVCREIIRKGGDEGELTFLLDCIAEDKIRDNANHRYTLFMAVNELFAKLAK